MSESNKFLKKKLKILLLLATSILLSINLYAQQITVRGTVEDNRGETLPGVSVVIKGTTQGTITDVSGEFTIQVPDENATLRFSYLGYNTKEVIVGSRRTLKITMAEEIASLDEVVVIGYGTVKRRDLTGAVASVRGEEIAANPVSNITQAIQGRLPGVNVITQDGRPGATVSVRVRGGGSITQSNEPLYIVDGFPLGSISDIPASEIESIDVLKDASSTAIYGARGANGVILVTTRRGSNAPIRVNYEGYIQSKNVSKKLETLSAQEYILHNWSYATSRGTANRDAVEKYFGLGSKYGNHYADYANVAAHNYTDDLLRSAFTHNHDISVSGGNEKTEIFTSLGYIEDEGVKINSDYNRINATLKAQQEIAKRLILDVDVRYSETNLNGRENVVNGKGSEISGAYTYRPIDNPLGGVHWSDVASGFGFGIANINDSRNPVKLVEDLTNKSYSRSLRGTAALSWEIIDGLIARTEASLSRNSSKSIYYENGYTNGEKRITLGSGMGNGFNSTTTLNYNFNLGFDNVFSVLAGNEVLTSESESSSINGRGYPDSFDYKTAMGLIQTATNTLTATNNIGVPSHTLSFFGRLNYTFKDRYLLTATFRADGSSKFAPNHGWGYFPAGAVAWRIYEEPFMETTKNWFSNLKLRLSLGISGADNISSNLWRETWSSLGAGSNHTPINGEFTPFYRPDGLLANPDLKWETTISRNAGIDFGFLNNRINSTLDMYWNTTKDLLMAVPVDNTTGYSYQFQNFGQTSNRGFELSLNAEIIKTKNFGFSAGAIYNYNLNRLDKLANADQYLYSSYWGSSSLVPTNDFMFQEGKAIGLVRGYISDGFYTVDDFNYENGQYILKPGTPDITRTVTATYMHPFSLPTGQTAFPGAAKFVDIDENGKIDFEDATLLGEVLPKHTGSFHFNFRYKNFDFSPNFIWVAGGKIYNVAAMINATGHEFDGIGEQRASWVAETYKVYNVNAAGDLYAVTDPAELKTLNANAKYHFPYHQSSITTSEWLEDGSYLRLQTLTLGYSLPKQLLGKAGMSNLRIYCTASNLFTITGYSGVDPEVNATPVGQSGFYSSLRIFPTPNMDFGTYPRSRTFTFGANITF
jgi:TonB-linked SusC/RagA family outer membrane protein